MPSVDDQARAIAEALSPTRTAQHSRWRWGTVRTVNSDGTMNVVVGGTELPSIRAAQHAMGAKVGDRVRVAYLGTDAMVDAVRATAKLMSLPTIDSNLMMSTVNRGYFLKDSAGNSYPGVFDNGSNLWLGSTATASTHHKGQTFISAGHNGTSGNPTIYVSVPNAANNGGTNYGVYHAGNKPTPADIGAQVAGSYQPAGSYATTNASGKIRADAYASADRAFYVQGTANNSTSVVNGKAVSLYVKTTGLSFYDTSGTTNGWYVYGQKWLYANASGSNGTITLNETAANFCMMEIFFKGNDGTYDSASVYSPNGKVVSLSMQESMANGSNNKKWRSVTISAKSITTKNYSEQDNAGTPSAANHIYICYVLGYYAQK